MVSKKAQDVIRSFGKKEYGTALFFPDAGEKPESLGL
jgi:tungstate transport system substrate-binding protein